MHGSGIFNNKQLRGSVCFNNTVADADEASLEKAETGRFICGIIAGIAADRPI
jgi:hypothetical protein